MKQINFKELPFYVDIKKEKRLTQDVREGFANLIYNNASGIRAHSLALKIYNSEGSIELTDGETEIVIETAERMCTPAFIDSVNETLNNNDL